MNIIEKTKEDLKKEVSKKVMEAAAAISKSNNIITRSNLTEYLNTDVDPFLKVMGETIMNIRRNFPLNDNTKKIENIMKNDNEIELIDGLTFRNGVCQGVLVPDNFPHELDSTLGEHAMDKEKVKNINFVGGVFNRTIISAIPVKSYGEAPGGRFMFYRGGVDRSAGSIILNVIQNNWAKRIGTYGAGFQRHIYVEVSKEEYIKARNYRKTLKHT